MQRPLHHPTPTASCVHPSISSLQWLYMDYPLATCSRRKLNRQTSLTHTRKHFSVAFYHMAEGGKKKCSQCSKNNAAVWSVQPGSIDSLYRTLQGIISCCRARQLMSVFISHHSNPTSIPLSVRRAQHLHPAYPLRVSRYLLSVVCVPVSRAFNRISVSTPVSGLKHFEMHFLRWAGFLVGQGGLHKYPAWQCMQPDQDVNTKLQPLLNFDLTYPISRTHIDKKTFRDIERFY